MSLRAALPLTVGIVMASGSARADGFHLFSTLRVAEIRDHRDAGAKGSRHVARAPLLVPPNDLESADSFRDDDLRIWSSTKQTTWHLLPPKLLGEAAAQEVVEPE